MQLGEMAAGCLRRHTGGKRQFARRERSAVKQRTQDIGAGRIADQRRHLGHLWGSMHRPNMRPKRSRCQRQHFGRGRSDPPGRWRPTSQLWGYAFRRTRVLTNDVVNECLGARAPRAPNTIAGRIDHHVHRRVSGAARYLDRQPGSQADRCLAARERERAAMGYRCLQSRLCKFLVGWWNSWRHLRSPPPVRRRHRVVCDRVVGMRARIRQSRVDRRPRTERTGCRARGADIACDPVGCLSGRD